MREDVQLLPGAPTVTGAATWLIFDPLANRYYQIDIEAYELLSAWAVSATAGDLQQTVQSRFGRHVELEAIASLSRILEQCGLLVEMNGGWRAYARRAADAKLGWIMWLVHNYLFIRVPLVRPERFLRATLPWASIFYTRTWFTFVVAVTIAGLYLTSRQWTAFVTTFQHFFSLDGLAAYAVALCVVKALHELGHAYTAMRFGCRVPTMGVALLVMMPMLYTDVTDAWKLKSRRQRMLVDAGGIIVELMLAGLATFAWAFLPDGPARGIAFVVATTSWMTTLLVNLSPLMRFDGYFLLADFVGIPNLQSRANALGRWKLRELLFDLKEPHPDRLPARTEAWVICYAWTIWIYRLVVFTGIALVVYHMFFKVLGVILFAVEIGWFILKPIASELMLWWERRGPIAVTHRSKVTAAVATTAILLAVVPWSGRVTVPAVIEPAEFARLFPVAPAMVSAVHVSAGQTVNAGDPIIDLQSPKLVHQLRQTETRIALLIARRDRRVADKKDKTDSLSIEEELGMLLRRRQGLQREIAELSVRAPIAGRIAEFPADMHVGRWLGRTDEIALIVSPKGLVARGYVHQDDLGRIEPGTKGSFSFDHPLHGAASVEVATVAYSGTAVIEIPELTSVHGGSIVVQEDKERGLVPNEGAYLVTLRPALSVQGISHVMRGVVHLSGKPESLMAAFWRQTLKVLVRESGA